LVSHQTTDFTHNTPNCRNLYLRLDENKPSPTVGNFRKSMFIHPTEDRGLSLREAARLQSFPDWYRFKGGISSAQQQIGNATPPLLAKAIAMQILHYMRMERADVHA
jgi:DNA (cytosine-5)-methyltransferase 1